MKDKVLYLIIGVLIGVIIMQATQGPQPAQAQAPEPIYGYFVVPENAGTCDRHYVMLSNGDVYRRITGSPWSDEPAYLGNFWNRSPVPSDQESWGGIKGKYDGKR